MSTLANRYEYSVVSPGTRAYEEYCALRHEVFCEELGRLPVSAANPHGLSMETDDYDVHSLHVLCRSVETGEAVGCARLILPGPNGLNVLSRYTLYGQLESVSKRVGEIGRLALSSKLRRDRCASRTGDKAHASSTAGDLWDTIKRDGPAVALGLYREILRLAHAYDISHCYAAMEPALARMFNRLCFPFQEAGPINREVQPPRQPFLIGAHNLRAGLEIRNSCLYQFLFGGEEVDAPRKSATWPELNTATLALPMALPANRLAATA